MGSVRGFPAFGIEIIFAFFQWLGIVFEWTDPVEDSGEVPDTMGTKMPELVGGDPLRALRPSHLDPFYGINCVGWTELVRKIDKFYTMQTLTNLPVQSGWWSRLIEA